jgi:PAS domain S-box-containing protein
MRMSRISKVLRSISNRFLLTGIILTVGILAMTGWLLADNRRATYDSAVNANKDILVGLEHDIRHSIDIMDLALRSTKSGAELAELTTLPDAVRQAVLFDGAAAADIFGGVYTTDKDGDIINDSAGTAARKINVADRDYFTAHRANADLGLLMTGPTLSRLDGRWALMLSRRLDRADGSFAGVAAGSIELDKLQDMFDGLSFGNEAIVALFTTEGKLLVRKPAGLADIGRDVSRGHIIGHLKGASSGVYEASGPIDGVSRIVVFRQVGTYPLGIAIGISRADLYAGWLEHTVVVAGALGCLLLLTAGLAWSLRRELRQRTVAESLARNYAGKMRMLTDHASDLLLRLDPHGRCRFVSPACETMLGYPVHILVSRYWMDLVHPEDRALLNNGLRYKEAPPSAHPVVRVQHQNGTWRHLESHGRALPSDGGVVLVVRDVTQRIDLEAKLRQAHRMEALGQLTAGVAHDFNNILQAQLGCLELLQDVLTESSDAWSLASQALELGERGARLTSQLRSFSRQQHLQPQAIPVAEFLAHLIETIGKTVQPKVRILSSVDPGTPALFADRAHLESALLNLVLNARDAMQDGGTISIRATSVEASVSEPDGSAGLLVKLRVADDGSGMDAATLERACEPFFTTKDINGTGLGLSSVQGFVAQSGGEFHISSEPGQGTIAELILPGVTAGEDVIAIPEARTDCVGRLLFVDDAPDVLVTVGSFLRGAGFDVVPAWGADVALRALQEEGPFDCLITDFAMPGMNGVELTTEARRLYPDLPALIITAWMEELHMAEVGPIWILQKPFRRDALVQELKRIIAPRQVQRAESPLVEGI